MGLLVIQVMPVQALTLAVQLQRHGRVKTVPLVQRVTLALPVQALHLAVQHQTLGLVRTELREPLETQALLVQALHLETPALLIMVAQEMLVLRVPLVHLLTCWYILISRLLLQLELDQPPEV